MGVMGYGSRSVRRRFTRTLREKLSRVEKISAWGKHPMFVIVFVIRNRGTKGVSNELKAQEKVKRI